MFALAEPRPVLSTRGWAGETSFDIEAVGEDGAGFAWIPHDSLPHSSISFELPREDGELSASSDDESTVSTTEGADLTIVDPEVCPRASAWCCRKAASLALLPSWMQTRLCFTLRGGCEPACASCIADLLASA